MAQQKTLRGATPLDSDEIRKVIRYADHVCVTLQALFPGFGYNPASIKILSDLITRERLDYNDERRAQLADLYGAFFGQVLVSAHPEAGGVWVRTDEGIGVQLGSSGRRRLVLPIARVRKHIDQGEVYSVFSLYAAICSGLDIDVAAITATGTPPG